MHAKGSVYNNYRLVHGWSYTNKEHIRIFSVLNLLEKYCILIASSLTQGNTANNSYFLLLLGSGMLSSIFMGSRFLRQFPLTQQNHIELACSYKTLAH